jgi:hypothetical protein
MPLALLEALVFGRLAVIIAVAGNPEVVAEGYGAFAAGACTVSPVRGATG